MEMIKVESTSLAAVGYEEHEKRLRVVFITGRIYNYFGVPEYTYQDLLNADSKGAFFNLRIRDSFAYEEEANSKSKGVSG